VTDLKRRKVLFIGYGNPGRQDDGLGPACAERIEARGLPGVKVDASYQLSVEDSAEVARHDCVVFADASVSGPEPFSFGPVAPSADMSFTSHSVSPGTVLAMARSLFKSRVQGFVLGIRGYQFDAFGEALSEGAQRNLQAAVRFLEETIRGNRFDEYATPNNGRSPEQPRIVLDLTAADLN
jgi:hydrogenase maturation protease